MFAAVVLGATGPDEVGARTGLAARTVAQALTRLNHGGLVAEVDGHLRADVSAFKEAVRRSEATAAPEELAPGVAGEAAAVLRTFVDDGRLRTIPVQRRKRRVVLEHIATVFEPGVDYPERAVNEMLNAWHPDHAALRRYLVDEGLMARENSVYHRVGRPSEL